MSCFSLFCFFFPLFYTAAPVRFWILTVPFSSAKKVKTLNILKEDKPKRNSEGKIVKAASYQSRGMHM